MKKLVEKFVEMPVWLHKPMWRIWHNLILRFDHDQVNVFLNYGYEGENHEFKDLLLDQEQEFHRFPIQLYSHTVRHHFFPGTDVLEVGCGRGGGAAFLAQTLKPISYTALDINENTTRFCQRRHKVPGLNFVTGDAENLPFRDHQFDAVVNVESARCYPRMDRFFAEVHRVLKPQGKFLFADMIRPASLEKVESMLSLAGLKMMERRDIRQNVVAALLSDHQGRQSSIDKKVPQWLRKAFYEFAGVPGTRRFEIFKTGEMGYYSFTLIKS